MLREADGSGASCRTSCARSGRSIGPSAASCRRSPPGRTSNASTCWCAKPCARPTPGSAISTPSPRHPGPGLIGGLIVGAITGKAIALARGLPFIAVHHLEAHALTVGLTEGVRAALPAAAGVGRAYATPHRARRRRSTSASARPSTMRSAKPSTRRRSCWGSASPAARRSSRPRARATRAASTCRGRCSGARSRTSPLPA